MSRNPVALANGQATLTTSIDGNVGTNSLTAFYEGDTTYTESISPSILITISNFALTSSGTTAAVGSATIANIAVNVANNYTNLISLTCTLSSNLTESACFVNPNSITGTGQVQLTVNTTPAHPLSSRRTSNPGWIVAGGGASLACIVLFVLPRHRGRNMAIGVLSLLAIVITVIGCGGATRIDPGTAKGTYTVVVTGTAGSGASLYQSSVNVPITVQ
jgi:hypothetical protein